MTQGRRYWLMKSEPHAFSIEDLAQSPKQTTCWDGVRNYQARNFMRAMSVGDQVLFYHSSVEPPVVVGIAEVVRAAYDAAGASAVHRAGVLQRLLRDASCLTHHISVNALSYELTGRVRSGIDTLSFRI